MNEPKVTKVAAPKGDWFAAQERLREMRNALHDMYEEKARIDRTLEIHKADMIRVIVDAGWLDCLTVSEARLGRHLR